MTVEYDSDHVRVADINRSSLCRWQSDKPPSFAYSASETCRLHQRRRRPVAAVDEKRRNNACSLRFDETPSSVRSFIFALDVDASSAPVIRVNQNPPSAERPNKHRANDDDEADNFVSVVHRRTALSSVSCTRWTVRGRGDCGVAVPSSTDGRRTTGIID